MMLLFALLLQVTPPPDIELNATATIRDLRVRQSGNASLTVRAEPDAGSDVRVDKPPLRGGRARNATVRVRAEARIASPENSGQRETPRPR